VLISTDLVFIFKNRHIPAVTLNVRCFLYTSYKTTYNTTSLDFYTYGLIPSFAEVLYNL